MPLVLLIVEDQLCPQLPTTMLNAPEVLPRKPGAGVAPHPKRDRNTPD
ncbi:hypothetical protein [uncultured Rikenella sp.]|nr:hypothetical protein [uncultured Rikenella sp.]